MEAVYRFKQKLCYLLLEKRLNQKKCGELTPKLPRMIAELREQELEQMVQPGNTLHNWRDEIATMWRFTRNNGITEGSIPKWRSCNAKLTDLETSTITG
jgi:transposase